jgi:RNA polymerase sigma-70 factor, ECF subfamily
VTGQLDEAGFGRLLADMRPRLHRYCARMVGSAFDGEDVVQEALAKAAEAFPAAGPIERPESWLFRIAHNSAHDALRRRKRQRAVRSEIEPVDVADSHAATDARVAATASLAAFMRLPATPRACVVLTDVLGYSAEETVAILGVSLAAAKAALRRGRQALQAFAEGPDDDAPALSASERDRLRAYADRFNARDFDALRDLLAEDVQLDMPNRRRLSGRSEVSRYFTHYDEIADWRLSPGLAEGRPALLVSDPADVDATVRYVVLLEWADGRIASIRDYRFAGYVMEGMAMREFQPGDR